MRSIRLSLVVYFTLLLTATLGTVVWFYYQDVTQSVHANEVSTRKLIETQYDDSCKKVRSDLDEHLLRRAQLFAGMARSNQKSFEALFILGQAATAPGPQAHLPAVIWAEHAASRYLQGRQYVLRPLDIRVESAEELMASVTGIEGEEYYQIFRENGSAADRSESMGEASFALDERLKKTEWPLYKEQFDDVELRPGLHVRRVTIKVALTRFRFQALPFRPPFGKPQPPAPDPRPKPPPPPRPRDSMVPVFYLQYAGDTEPRDQKLAELASKRDADLALLGRQSERELHDMHQRLIWLSMATFVAIIVGSLCLVQFGMKSLDRLTDAVSRVSERDFRLQFDDRKLPRELQPIVSRLQSALEMLKRAFAREKQAAADISHELRTPLAALMTTIDLALRKPRSSEEYRDLLEACRGSGQQMTQLVERMLALARLDSGVDQVRPREVDVEGLADQCASLVRPLAEARGVTLRVHHHGPAPLTTDPDKLREVLTNLLHNAIEYNKTDGSIDVEIDRVNGDLRVEVRDTGIGISPDARQHIFERFFRADPSRQSEGLHAGIGLAIVKGYVDLMGGAIEVDSVVGEGSTFRLHLPLHASSH